MHKYFMKLEEINLRIMTPEKLEETTIDEYKLAFSLASDLVSDKHSGKRNIPTKSLFDYVVNQEFPNLKGSSDYISTGSSEGKGVIIVFR